MLRPQKYELCSALAQCDSPMDAAVVSGIVEQLLVATLPPDSKPKEIAKVLEANAMCLVPVLELMDEDKLEGFGVLPGYAVLVCMALVCREDQQVWLQLSECL